MTRLTDAEALELLRSRDLLGVGARAHEVRERLVPGPRPPSSSTATSTTPTSASPGCRFCAFHCKPGRRRRPTCSRTDEIHDKIQETLDLGGTAVMMQGGLHPELDIAYYEDLFRSIKERLRHHHPFALGAGDRSHRQGQRPVGAGGAAPPEGGGARLAAGRAAPRSWWTGCASRWRRGKAEHPRRGWA